MIRWNFIDAGQFSDYHVLWDHLNACGPHSPLLNAAFMQLALNHFGNGQEKLGIAYRDYGAVAMALFSANRFGTLIMFQPSQLPLGPLVASGEVSFTEVVKGLAESLPFQYAFGALTQIDPLLYGHPDTAEYGRIVPHIETGYINLPQTHTAYLNDRPKKKCAQVIKRINKAQADLGEAKLSVYSDVHEVAPLVEAYADMESAGWKAKAGSAVSRGGPQAKFYTAVLQHFAETGRLKIFTLHFGERLAAMQLAVNSEGCLYLLKSSYDETLKDYSPGVVLKHYLIEYLFRSREPFHRVEFYGRVIEPHRLWITGSRELFHLNLYRTPLLARLHDAMRGRTQPALASVNRY